ncbi:hypothetical protein XENOCAPTIV_021363 [Xenoophorus captivus]|uniref:Uncharacterized protein n=1 Tax=Xenoophorus captivus TaxID=1517983 RepID=A0ABV0QC51_9TELE
MWASRDFPRQPQRPLGRLCHGQTDHCVADAKERPFVALDSHNIPLLKLLWETKEKHLNRWLSNTSSPVARQKGASSGCCLCSPRAASQGNQEKVSVDESELATLIRMLLYKEMQRSNSPSCLSQF